MPNRPSTVSPRAARRALLPLLSVLVVGWIPGSPLAAQTPETEVGAVVQGLFDAMRAGDRAAAEALFHPEAALGGPARSEEGVTLRMSGTQDFLEAVGSDEREWDERIWDVQIRVDGDLATAWMNYAFFLDGEFSHCGVNAFQLFRSAAGWKIFVVSDTRRQDDCGEIPER